MKKISRRKFLALAGMASLSAVAAPSAFAASQPENGIFDWVHSVFDPLTVGTTYGYVKGVAQNGVNVWYGIPYGKNPVGELRWQAPQAPDAWDGTKDCTQPAEVAMQLSGSAIIGTEDCLNLDIYAKAGARDKPVLVFVHGGNNQTGNTKELLGNDMVVRDDCVLVTLNYRLGLLGFNCLPALTEGDNSGNFALEDIAEALKWVRKNIAGFGGDPDNVTVSGFSAGGRDVMAMLISPLFAGKFDRAISFSGGMTTAEVEPSTAKIAAAIAPLVVEDGKASNEALAYLWLQRRDEAVREYLYSLSSERLCRLMGNAGIRMSVFPHLYTDGLTLPKEGFATNRYNDVPTMLLTGSGEFSMFCLGDALFKTERFASMTEEELAAAKAYAVKYGSDMYRISNAEVSAETMYDNYISPIYICQIDYGTSEDTAPLMGGYGAFHGVFVPMLSTVNNYTAFMPDAFVTEGYKQIADVYNRYLTNFMRTGDPNGDGLMMWDNWTPENKCSLVLDATVREGSVTCGDVSKTYSRIINEMIADDTVEEDVKQLINTKVINGRWFSAAQDAVFAAPDLWRTGYELI